MSKTRSTLWRLMTILASSIVALGGPALADPRAIPAAFVPDEELATRPVIVVARWKDAPFVSNHKTEGNVLKEWEVLTEVAIERVIKGDLKPGKHKVQVGYAIGWEVEGGPVASHMSTEQMGDIEEVCDPNLWFFSHKKSWDINDKTEYLYLDTFRGVQPLALEKYFAALASNEPKKEVPKLLQARDPRVVTRVLEYISGGRLPWPYEPWDFIRPKAKKKPPLTSEAPQVAALLDPQKDTEIRTVALAVYAELAGKDALAKIRELVADKEVPVRAIAAGLLAGYHDDESIDALCKAAASIAPGVRGEHRRKEAHIVCEFIQRCGDWGDSKLVPAVIPFLQNDTFVYQMGDDLGIPAFKAGQALKKLTGLDFPLDVAASTKAWDRVKALANKEEQIKRLSSILSSLATPLVARVVNKDGKPSFVITNMSKHTVNLAKTPAWVEVEYSGGSGSYGGGEIKGKDDFQEVAPGATMSVVFERNIDSLPNFLAADPSSRKLVLRFLRNGGEFGLNAWIGNLEAKFEEGWKEPGREVKAEEERWPNGELKARGPTLNGKRHGTWYEYREDGKKIREVEYFNGNITKIATLNPNYVPPEEKKK
jgi:hypothetical protein